MASRYLLESSSVDGYLLEDGSGVLLLEGADQTGSWVESAPQSVSPQMLAGFGAVFAAIALFAPVQPTSAGAVYQTGTHEAAQRSQVIGASEIWGRAHTPPSSFVAGFIETWSQPVVSPPSLTWCAAEYTVAVSFLSQGAVGEQEEPRYQPSKIWGQTPPSAAVVTTIVRPIALAVQETLYQNGSWVREDVAQYARLQTLLARPIIQTQAEVPLQAPASLWTNSALIAPVQPDAGGAQYAFGSHSLLYDYAGRSAVWNATEHAPPPVVVPGKSLGTQQEFPATSPSGIQTSPAIFLERPVIRQISGRGIDVVQEVWSRVTEAWVYAPPVVQSPVGRPIVSTQAEIPVTAPSLFWGDVPQYAPPQPDPEGAEYRYGGHSAAYDYAGRSRTWGYPGFVPPVVQSPVNRPIFLGMQDSRPIYERQNGSVFWNTVVISLQFPVVTAAVVGDFDPPPYQASKIWGYPGFQVAPPVTIVRPLVQTSAEVPQNPPSAIWGGAEYTEQFVILVQEVVGDPEEPRYQPSSIWGNAFSPPPPVQNPPLRPAIVTYPQPDIQLRPSSVWHKPPPTVQSPAKFSFVTTYPTEAKFLESNHSLVVPIGARGIPTDITLTSIVITVYQGNFTPEVYKVVPRVITYPKYLGATAQLDPPFNFAKELAAGETLTGATVTATVYTGTDASPSNILSGTPVIDGANVKQMMTGGIVGVVYDLLCTATTSAGQILVQNTYFYVEPNLP